MATVPVLSFTVYTVIHILWAGLACGGSTANRRLEPPARLTAPDRYTTPPLTAQDGAPYSTWLAVAHPLIANSLCQVTPLAGAPVLAWA